MGEPKPALYAAGVTALGFVCLALACFTAFVPIWGHYEDNYGGYSSERGYFGPWKVCKKLNYGREVCGDQMRFRVSSGVYISGILALISCICFAIFDILSIIQIAMITSREKVVLKYKSIVIIKLTFAVIAALLAVTAAILFAIEIDSSNRHFIISRGISFYIQIVLIVLGIALAVMAVYDVIFSNRTNGDPTAAVAISTATATTYNNPGFREGRSTNGAASSISVTDSSGRPYTVGSNGHGSLMSMNTTVTSVSNGSTMDSSITRSPLRSSLKKPRPKDGLGIQNPGYSGSNQSPHMQRSGSVKKVRIQTHSTDV